VPGRLGTPSSTQIVVGLLVALGLDGFGLIVGIEDHIGEITNIAIITPPPGSEYRVEAMGTFARWRLAFESGFEPRSGARQSR
jgi:hypothetical protein